MATGAIKGITISFAGDTTKLDKALRQIQNNTKSLDKELKQVDKALKFNPTSVELWRQKQQLLTQKVEETKSKLDALKQAQAQMDASGVDKNSKEYRELQREIIVTENQVKTFKGQLNQVGNVNLRAASEQFKQWGSSLTEAGQKMQGLSIAAAAVVASLGAISYKAGQNADDLNTLSKVYSINTTDLQKYAVAADLVDVSVEDIAKSHVKLEKSMYSAQNGSKSQAEAFEKLGVSVTNADGSLRSSDAVWQDTITALGQMTNETERDAIAQQLMGKSAANLNPLIEDQGETYKNLTDTLAKYDLDFVDQETLDGANQFNDALDTMKAIGSVALSTVGSQLAAYLAPALEKVVGWIGQLASWLSNLSPEVLTVIGIIAGVVAAVAPVLIFLGKLATGISSILSLASTLGVSIGALAGPFGIALAVIAALIAIGVLLYKNWDTIKAKAIEIKDAIVAKWNELKTSVTNIFDGIKTAISNAWQMIKLTVVNYIRSTVNEAVHKWNELKTSATTIWNNIKSAITTPIQTAKDTVKGIIDKIKSYFPFHIGKIMSGLKLPHFKLTGSFSLKNMTVPHLSVDWYKTGGIFDSPSVIGVGEAGAEAVVPLNKLWEKLDKIAEANSPVVVNVYGSDNMSVNELAAAVEQRIIQMQKRRTQVWV